MIRYFKFKGYNVYIIPNRKHISPASVYSPNYICVTKEFWDMLDADEKITLLEHEIREHELDKAGYKFSVRHKIVVAEQGEAYIKLLDKVESFYRKIGWNGRARNVKKYKEKLIGDLNAV